MLELLQQGGPIMWAIFACALAATAIFFERLFHLHRAQIRIPDFLEGIFNIVRAGKLTEAVSLCEETPGPVARLVRAAVLHLEDEPDRLGRAVDHAGLAEIPRLQRRVIALSTLAYIAPLLGLLGTVTGLLEIAAQMQAGAPLVHMGDVATGLWHALLTTAAGLAVAIPAAVGYHVLLSRVDALLQDMETAASELDAFRVRLKRPIGGGIR